MSNSELPQYIQRLERMNEEIAALRSDRKDILDEAASKGFDKKALARIVRERARKSKNPEKFKQETDNFDVYASSMNLFE